MSIEDCLGTEGVSDVLLDFTRARSTCARLSVRHVPKAYTRQPDFGGAIASSGVTDREEDQHA
jgi:hypothetical protein